MVASRWRLADGNTAATRCRRARRGSGKPARHESYDQRNAQERTWDIIGAVEEIAKSKGCSMAQVALA